MTLPVRPPSKERIRPGFKDWVDALPDVLPCQCSTCGAVVDLDIRGLDKPFEEWGLNRHSTVNRRAEEVRHRLPDSARRVIYLALRKYAEPA